VGAAYAEVDAAYPDTDPYRRRHEALRRVFGVMVADVIDTSRKALAESGATSAAEIRMLGRPVIRFSDAMWADLKEIRAFLFRRMYRAPSVMKKRAEVTQVVEELFPFFLENPQMLPRHWARQIEAAGRDRTSLARMVCDYIAGMTDRFAYAEHARLIGARGLALPQP
jgi:dGTPase